MVNSIHVYSRVLTKIFNDCVKNGNSDMLNYADITPVFKKDDVADKSNYRPISIFPNFSKIFKKMIYNQISSFMEPKLSKYLADLRKNHDTQHILLMIGTWAPFAKQR